MTITQNVPGVDDLELACPSNPGVPKLTGDVEGRRARRMTGNPPQMTGDSPQLTGQMTGCQMTGCQPKLTGDLRLPVSRSKFRFILLDSVI